MFNSQLSKLRVLYPRTIARVHFRMPFESSNLDKILHSVECHAPCVRHPKHHAMWESWSRHINSCDSFECATQCHIYTSSVAFDPLKNWEGTDIIIDLLMHLQQKSTHRRQKKRSLAVAGEWVSLQNAPVFRLLLKVAVNGTHQCDFLNFWGTFGSQQYHT